MSVNYLRPYWKLIQSIPSAIHTNATFPRRIIIQTYEVTFPVSDFQCFTKTTSGCLGNMDWNQLQSFLSERIRAFVAEKLKYFQGAFWNQLQSFLSERIRDFIAEKLECFQGAFLWPTKYGVSAAINTALRVENIIFLVNSDGPPGTLHFIYS